MPSTLEDAVDTLLTELTKQEQEVRETKRMINNLLRRIGKPERFPDADDAPAQHANLSIRIDQFYGKPLATVVQQILEMRKQACTADELMKTLISGGFDFDSLGWKETDRLRSFTMTLAKNTKAFHRLPGGAFGLPEWYPEAMKKKQVRQATKDATEVPDDATEEPNTAEAK
jgi:hypothetical protein